MPYQLSFPLSSMLNTDKGENSSKMGCALTAYWLAPSVFWMKWCWIPYQLWRCVIKSKTYQNTWFQFSFAWDLQILQVGSVRQFFKTSRMHLSFIFISLKETIRSVTTKMKFPYYSLQSGFWPECCLTNSSHTGLLSDN